MNRRLHFFRASRRLHPDSPADAIFLTMGDLSYHGLLREAFRLRASIP
jgi:hypothetical protein